MSHNFNANTVIGGKVTVPFHPSSLLGRDMFKKHIIEKQEAFDEIHKLLEYGADEEGNDEIVQFEADEFIDNQFCMTRSKKKRTKESFKGLAAAIALQEQMGFQLSYRTCNTDKNDRGRSDSLEDANQRLLEILRNPLLNEPKNSQAESKELNMKVSPSSTIPQLALISDLIAIPPDNKELESVLIEAYEAYHLGHWSPASIKYKTAWEIITDATFKSQVKHIDKDVVCYMLCITLLETGELNNLSNSMELLLNLEPHAHQFPAIYYALSKAHYKYYRFAPALKAVEQGFAALDSGIQLIEHTIPGSTVVLSESTRDRLSASLTAMYDECSRWHPPDAVCSMYECVPTTRWYGPSQDIYFGDPTFNGMVIVNCSNTRHPCTIIFHQACWKLKKDQLSAITKLPDKDIIGYECFTPNCETDQDSPSLITKVEIYGDDGKLKTQIVAPANSVPWGKQRLQPKGAIPKQPVKPKRLPEKIRRPIPTAVPRSSSKERSAEDCTEKVWRLTKLAELRKNNFGIMSIHEWRPDKEMYGNPHMMEIGFMLEDPPYERDCPKQVGIKTFIFTYFYEFIKENGCVTRDEISSKWEEDKFLFNNQSRILDNEIDICEFLLQSYKLASVGPYIGIAENLPELYAVVKSEVCGCLKFLLAGPAYPRAAAINDDIFNIIISDYDEEEQIQIGVVESSKEPKMVETINSVPLATSTLSFSDSLRTEDINIESKLSDPKQSHPVRTGPNHFGQTHRDRKSEVVKCELGVESKRSESTLETMLNLSEEAPPEIDPFGKENKTTHVNEQPRESEPINHKKTISSKEFDIQKSLVDLQAASIDIIPEFRAVKPVENNILEKGTSLASLDESNVEKIETDLERALTLLKSALDQSKVRSENHAELVQQEFDKYKLISEQRLSELLKDSNHLEVLCAKYETEKSDLRRELDKLQLDLSRRSEGYLALKWQYAEVVHDYDKLSKEKNEVEHNFDVLLRENSLIKQNLEMLRREKEKMEKKLDKYRIRLKEKIDTEIKNSLEKEQKRLEEAKLSERKSQLHSLNQEFRLCSFTFEKAVEKCHDHLHMLNEIGKVVTSLTGQQFTLAEARVAWQRCEYHLRLTITKYKEDYAKLKALLESDQQIENLEHVKLPPLNIVFPEPLNLSEVFYKGQTKFLSRPTNVPPNLWCMQGALSADQCRMPANPYYMNTYFHPSVNSLHNIPYKPGSFNNGSSQSHADATGSPMCNTSVGINIARFNQTIQHNNVSEKVYPKTTRDITDCSIVEQGPVIHQVDQVDISTNPSDDIQKSEAKDNQSNDLSYDALDKINGNNGQIPEANYNSVVADMTSVDGATQISSDRHAVLGTVGIDLLIQELKEKFVGVPEFDLLESVMDVRKLHNNTLSGMRVAHIIRESEPFIRQRQLKHFADYTRPQQVRSGRLRLSPNRRSEPNSRSSTTPGQQRTMKKLPQNESGKLVNSLTKVSQVAAIVTKPAWRPVKSGLIDWVKNEEDSECIICFENMNALDKKAPIYALPCQHSFHHACIKKWLGEVSVCPICKMHCTMDDEFPPLPL